MTHKPEIQKLRLAVGRNEQVLGLHIPVDQTLIVRSGQLSFAKIESGGHLECAAVVKPLRHTATSPE